MSVFSEETKKLLVKRKILLIVLLVLIVKAGLSFAFAGQNNLFSDRALNEKYLSYMAVLKGSLTPEKEQFVLDEKQKLDESDSRINAASEQVSSGQIPAEEFESIVFAEAEYQNSRPVIERIYKQYDYVSSEPSERHFIDPVGWDNLLANEQPDYLLLLAVIIICAIVFNCETESRMSVLNLTASNGRAKLCEMKIMIGSAVCLLLSVAFFFIDVGAEWLANGLDGAESPIQSIPFFESSSRHIPLSDLLVQTLALRLLGVWFLSACGFMVSVYSKSTIITLFSNLALALIPLFLLGNSGFMYRLPLPTGFFVGSGFFRGTESVQMDDGSMVYMFREVTNGTFITLVVFVASISCLLCAVSALRYVSARGGGYRENEI